MSDSNLCNLVPCFTGFGQDCELFASQIQRILDGFDEADHCQNLSQNTFQNSSHSTLGQDLKCLALDYQNYFSFEQLKEEIGQKFLEAKMVFGWSLGGQVALKLIADGVLNPDFLVLISTPFCLVEKSILLAIKNGLNQRQLPIKKVPVAEFKAFLRGFKNDPQNFLQEFSAKIANNQLNAKEERFLKEEWQICYENKPWQLNARILNQQNGDFEKLLYWLNWLGSFDCADLKKEIWPKTLIIHCQSDFIVSCNQAFELEKMLNNGQNGQEKSKEISEVSAQNQKSQAQTSKNIRILLGTTHAPHIFYPKIIQKFLEKSQFFKDYLNI